MYKCICRAISQKDWEKLLKEKGEKAYEALGQECGICLEREENANQD